MAGGCHRKLGTGPGQRCPVEQRHPLLQTEAPAVGPGCASEGHRGAPPLTMAPSALWNCYLCCLLTTVAGAASYPPRGYSLYTGGGGALSPGEPQAQSAPRPASRHR